MDARKVRRLKQVLLEWPFAIVLRRGPRKTSDERGRALHQASEQLRFFIVSDSHEALEFSPGAVGVTIGLDKAKYVLYSRAFIPDPNPLGLTVGV